MTNLNRARNEEVRTEAQNRCEKNMSDRVERNILKRLGHAKRMRNKRLTRGVSESEAENKRIR